MKLSSAVIALAALAQETRLEIFRMLVQSGPRGMCAGDIAKRLKLPLPTLSFHLSQLRHARLIKSRREGRSIFYAADYAAMNGLLAFMMQNCCAADTAGCGDSAPCAPTAAPPAMSQRLRKRARA